ncbi:MAG: hypothetical protein Q4E06_02905 [Lautropia sp.]|nr:hypothetical protein [Lautropia sp.]
MLAFNSCGPALTRGAAALACASIALPVLAAPPAASPPEAAEAFAASPAGPRAPTPADTEVLAAACSNCHGPVDHPVSGIPSLFGQPAERLLARMQAFQAGTAPDATVMPRLMKGYDAAELQALARWFARQPAAAEAGTDLGAGRDRMQAGVPANSKKPRSAAAATATPTGAATDAGKTGLQAGRHE